MILVRNGKNITRSLFFLSLRRSRKLNVQPALKRRFVQVFSATGLRASGRVVAIFASMTDYSAVAPPQNLIDPNSAFADALQRARQV